MLSMSNVCPVYLGIECKKNSIQDARSVLKKAELPDMHSNNLFWSGYGIAIDEKKPCDGKVTPIFCSDECPYRKNQ